MSWGAVGGRDSSGGQAEGVRKCNARETKGAVVTGGVTKTQEGEAAEGAAGSLW